MNTLLNFMARSFLGLVKIWQAFWLGFLIALIFKIFVLLVASGVKYIVGEGIVSLLFLIPLLWGVLIIEIWYFVSVWRCRKNCFFAPFAYLAVSVSFFLVVMFFWQMNWFLMMLALFGSVLIFFQLSFFAIDRYPLQSAFPVGTDSNLEFIRDGFTKYLGKDVSTNFEDDFSSYTRLQLFETWKSINGKDHKQSHGEAEFSFEGATEVELMAISQLASDFAYVVLPLINIRPNEMASRLIYEIWLDHDIKQETAPDIQSARVNEVQKRSRRKECSYTTARYGFCHAAINESVLGEHGDTFDFDVLIDTKDVKRVPKKLTDLIDVEHSISEKNAIILKYAVGEYMTFFQL